jgi:hypothetical protein
MAIVVMVKHESAIFDQHFESKVKTFLFILALQIDLVYPRGTDRMYHKRINF